MTRSKRCIRRGSILVAVLVCLTIVSSLALGAVATAVRSHREVKLHHQLRQTDRLVDSGFRRAIAKIDSDPTYDGEVWNPKLESFEGQIEVSIKVDPLRCVVRATMHPAHGQITARSDQIQLVTNESQDNE